MKKFIVLFLSLLGISFAETNFSFRENSKGFCLNESSLPANACLDANGENLSGNTVEKLRMFVMDAPATSAGLFGFFLERPFFILDGIHLSTEEPRTMTDFKKEVEAFGIPEVLKTMGYNPVLIQFPHTVYMSLQDNSKTFAELLKYLNGGRTIPFPNKNDGFIVLGISQGGIIGRYGAYLYDTQKSKNDAPIRLYASLDSPHQGAVMPRSLIATLDFWANNAGEGVAKAFHDLIVAPGARDLLIYETTIKDYPTNLESSRFLFGEYRKAAEYKGFPAVLIAEGQLKGKEPEHHSEYYSLNREIGKIWNTITFGRASSHMRSYGSKSGEYAYNRKYDFSESGVKDRNDSKNGTTPFDFIPGSTYPFAQIMYESIRPAFLEKMPNKFNYELEFSFDAKLFEVEYSTDIELTSKWVEDTLYQANSTFIPTVSAMDLKCDGDLAIRKDCRVTQTANGLNFENMGSRSTANAAYAVDPTHPRFNEPISGRHIEPVLFEGQIFKNVLEGFQVDMWRLLCEVAKNDYNSLTNEYRNPKLKGFFSPKASCMEQKNIPDFIKNGGVLQTKRFAYARYDYQKIATEVHDEIAFDLPLGWNKVATFDNGENIPANSVFEVDIRVDNPKANWMKAELLITQTKGGGGHVQLTEQNVNQDGYTHTLRWQMPSSPEMLLKYRWFRLILNSNGANVVLSKPRLVLNAKFEEELPPAIPSANIYPNNNYNIIPWSNLVRYEEKTVNGKNALVLSFDNKDDGIHFDFGKTYSMEKYKELVVEFIPETCTQSAVFFDTKAIGNLNLVNSSLQNGIAKKILQLSDVVNTSVTPKGAYTAKRLSLQGRRAGEKCSITSLKLQ